MTISVDTQECTCEDACVGQDALPYGKRCVRREIEEGDFRYIRRYYDVPARRGGRIRAEGRDGLCVGAAGPYVLIQLHGDKHVGRYHPTSILWIDQVEAA